LTLILTIISMMGGTVMATEPFEEAPIFYSKTSPKDAARRLERRLREGHVKLDRSSPRTVLQGLLKAFGIPESSQVMVFSKTSHQNGLISPRTPRVVYFGDNAYVGYCVGGVIEVTTIDPELGPIFYVIDPTTPARQPLQFQREQSCLSCHGGTFETGVPGVLVRSVFPNDQGHPIMSQGSTLVDTTTPFEERWGGWYVTGTHGDSIHRGNVIAEELEDGIQVDFEDGANVEDLSQLIDTRPYLRETSDIVALMVLEHQTSTQNILTRAAHTARRAIHMQVTLQRALGEKVRRAPEGSARRIIDNCAEDVLDAILFKDEAELPEGGIEGDPAFQEAFTAEAPTSSDGRSLKDFRLLHRLFKYRCSYMVYSETFEHLPSALKATVFQRLGQILEGQDPSLRYDYLSESERGHIRRILGETLPSAPAAWRKTVAQR
jgi:hypothetical protein